MSNVIPIKSKYINGVLSGLSEFESGDILPVQYGGTGVNSLTSLVTTLSPLLFSTTTFTTGLSTYITNNVPNINTLLPSQTGNANKVLVTNGTTVSWIDVNELIVESLDLGTF